MSKLIKYVITTFIINLVVITVTLFCLVLFSFFAPDLFVGMSILNTFLLLPALAFFIGYMLIKLIAVSFGIKNKILYVTPVVSTIVTLTLIISAINHPPFLKYMDELSRNRTNYDDRFVFNEDKMVDESKIQEISAVLPPQWHLKQIAYDNNSHVYWIRILEPSFWYGSKSYLGAYNSWNKNLNFCEEETLWNNVKNKKRLDSDSKYDSVDRLLKEGAYYYSVKGDTSYKAFFNYADGEITIRDVSNIKKEIIK